jgi:hypothetical protein
MKQCNRCNEEKEITEFYKNSKRVYPYCKACARKTYAETHYQNNKELYLKRTAGRNKMLRKSWIEFKSKFKCTKCNENRHWCIDFHHVDSSLKEGLIPKFFKERSREVFEKEFNKCIPLCRNCHADLHYNERQNSISV